MKICQMKIYLFYIFLSIIFSSQARDHLLTVVIMVKDESHVIKETLQPFVDSGIDHFLVFDTGSTDNTISVTKEFFKEYNVQNGIIIQEEFIDFSTSRNRALQIAEDEFSDGCFMIMPDAEWYIQNVEGLISFCEKNKDENCPAYLVRITNANLDFYTARLIRCGFGIRFNGVVHEVLNYCVKEKVSQDVFFELGTSRYGREKSEKRWARDAKLLLKEYNLNPSSARTVFYLGQTYACLGDWENARKWYEIRTTMSGWDEENFMAFYKLAQVYENLDNWEKALHYYFLAISARPHRAEPFVKLANHYWNVGDKDLCFLFASRAVELPYPEEDILFVEKDAYVFTRYDLLGRSAWYVGENEIGEKAVIEALKIYPESEYLKKNLCWYK